MSYWNQLHDRYGVDSDIKALVIHISVAWDLDSMRGLYRLLISEFPQAFVRKVVFVSIDGANLYVPPNTKTLLPLLPFLPSVLIGYSCTPY